MPSSYQSPESQDRTKNKNLRTKIIAALVVLITAVTTTIYVWDHVTKRESSTETLSINQKSGALEDTTENPTTAEPPTSDNTTPSELPKPSYDTVGDIRLPYGSDEDSWPWWRIPLTASFEDFPLDTTIATNVDEAAAAKATRCTDEELEWLRKNAFPSPSPDPRDSGRTFNVAIRNEAFSGGAMSLSNIRFEGSEVPAVPTIHFACPNLGNGDSGHQEWLISVDGQPAIYGRELDYDPPERPQYPEGTPVTLNLQPGEYVSVLLTRDESVDTQKQYEGRFLADVVGTDETVILADNVEFTRNAIPEHFIGFTSGNTRRLSTFVCADGQTTTNPCTLEEAANLMRRAAEHIAQ